MFKGRNTHENKEILGGKKGKGLAGFKMYHKATVIKAFWYSAQYRFQCSRILIFKGGVTD